MDTAVEIVGVYPIENEVPVHLVEILVQNFHQAFDRSGFTQKVDAQPRENWQVPWDEKLLNKDGNEVIADGFLLSKEQQLWVGDLRLTFFFHYLDLSKPFVTPFGYVDLPKETIKPERLSRIVYESPD